MHNKIVIILLLVFYYTCKLPAQTIDTWRLMSRYTNEFCFPSETEPGYNLNTSETVTYSQSNPDVLSSLFVQTQMYGENWVPQGTWYFHPDVSYQSDYKIVTYSTNSSLHYRREVYDNQNRLYQLTQSDVNPDSSSWYGERQTFFYRTDNTIDSVFTYGTGFLSAGRYYTKRIPTYDSEDRKQYEIIYISTDSLVWNPLKKNIFTYTGETYPEGFKYLLYHPMYVETFMSLYFPGLITPAVVDSVIEQEYYNGQWQDKLYDRYIISINPDTGVSISITVVELDMLPYPPDYWAPCYDFGFDIHGLYSGDYRSCDDGLSPPWFLSTGYTWEHFVPNEDNLETLPALLKVSTYPNPFRTSLNIAFTGKDKAPADVSIFNIKGQLIRTWKQTKSQEISWDGTDDSNKSVSSGVYLIKAQQGSSTICRKVIKF